MEHAAERDRRIAELESRPDNMGVVLELTKKNNELEKELAAEETARANLLVENDKLHHALTAAKAEAEKLTKPDTHSDRWTGGMPKTVNDSIWLLSCYITDFDPSEECEYPNAQWERAARPVIESIYKELATAKAEAEAYKRDAETLRKIVEHEMCVRKSYDNPKLWQAVSREKWSALCTCKNCSGHWKYADTIHEAVDAAVKGKQ